MLVKQQKDACFCNIGQLLSASGGRAARGMARNLQAQPVSLKIRPLSCVAVIGYIRFAMRGIFCTKEVSSGIDGKAFSVRALLHKELQGCNVYTLDQVHSDRIVFAEDITPGEIPEADAIISRNVNDVLCVRTADCVPVLAWAEDVPLIAAIHAGWRGLALNIVEQCITAMRSLGSKTIRASIGPAIGKCCYVVQSDVIEALRVEPSVNGQGFLVVDLWEAAACGLERAGVGRSSIEIKGVCTSCDTDRFFSYRRQGEKAGRNISAIGGRSWSLPGLQVG